jgi:hypothetical protein
MSPLDEIEIRNDVNAALKIITRLRPRLQRVALLRALGQSHREVETRHFGRGGLARALASRSDSDAPSELCQLAVEALGVLEEIEPRTLGR